MSKTILMVFASLVLGLSQGAGALPEEDAEHPLFGQLRWRNIGPANMMGRIAAIDALNDDYRVVLVGSASGGVFKSTNGGTTWEPIFDHSGAGSIGDVAFFQPEPDIIWVGTGESANRNSSGWGDGIYKSTDGGKTFDHMGLRETHNIAELAVHPTDKNTVYAAAVGHLWGYSGERGLYKTTDGGQSWTKLTNGLPDDGRTGATEIIMDPANPDVLYTGFYHRLRQPATMTSGGPNGGIFKSTDAGQSWRELTGGLPTGETGMIDISIHHKDPRILVANVEADQNLSDDLSVPGPGVYRSDDGGESWSYLLRHNMRPFYHGQIEIDPLDDQLIYVVSRDYRVSRDGGKTFDRKPWRGAGGDDHDMWIAPYDSKTFYVATDQGAYLTLDGGENFLAFDNMAIGQYYAIGVDMRDPYWVVGGLQDNGIWMGPSNSRELRGILNMHNTWIAEGDGFHSQVDPTDWRTVYTVNHVGFVARQNIETRQYHFITPTPETIANFDDYADPIYEETPTVYTIAPGEHWFFRERPDRPLLPPQFRFNWSSPFIISPNNPRTVYFGGNHLFKSTDRGDTWRIISPDLTTNDPQLRNPSTEGGLTTSVTGGENHFNIMTIAESPLLEGLLWVGTDDGNVQVSRNGGVDWENVRANIPGIPEKIWVSRVEASHFDEATAYVTFDNHRYDDYTPYVFETTDYGKSWTSIASNLPDGGSVYVIREDFRNPNLLFVGTEFAVYASVDGGASWARIMRDMPTVAVHDLAIHPRDADLVAGTHGRSIWILDDITPLQQLTDEVLASDAHLFELRTATKWRRINLGRKQSFFLFRGENPPRGAAINFYLKAKPEGEVEIEVQDLLGEHRQVLGTEAGAGIHRIHWNLRFEVTEEQKLVFASHLEERLETLSGMAKEDGQEKLVGLSARLEEVRELIVNPPEPNEEAAADDAGEEEAPDPIRQLNEIRRELTQNFGIYAGGEPFFGGKLGPVDAPAGEYLVTLKVGGESYRGRLKVRDDPLMDKPYN